MCTTGAAHGQELARPDSFLTPGAVDPNVTLVGTSWLQPNEHGCIFHAGPVLGLFLRSRSVRSLREEDRTMMAQVDIAAGEHALVAIVADEDQPLGVPQIAYLSINASK